MSRCTMLREGDAADYEHAPAVQQGCWASIVAPFFALTAGPQTLASLSPGLTTAHEGPENRMIVSRR